MNDIDNISLINAEMNLIDRDVSEISEKISALNQEVTRLNSKKSALARKALENKFPSFFTLDWLKDIDSFYYDDNCFYTWRLRFSVERGSEIQQQISAVIENHFNGNGNVYFTKLSEVNFELVCYEKEPFINVLKKINGKIEIPQDALDDIEIKTLLMQKRFGSQTISAKKTKLGIIQKDFNLKEQCLSKLDIYESHDINHDTNMFHNITATIYGYCLFDENNNILWLSKYQSPVKLNNDSLQIDARLELK